MPKTLTGSNSKSATVIYKAALVGTNGCIVDVKVGRHLTGSLSFKLDEAGSLCHQSTANYSKGRGIKPVDIEQATWIAKRALKIA